MKPIDDLDVDLLTGGAGEDYIWGTTLEVIDNVTGEIIDTTSPIFGGGGDDGDGNDF